MPNKEDYAELRLMERIRDAIQKGGKVGAVSKKTGIPIGTLNKYVALRSAPSVINAIKIAQAVGMSFDDLAFDISKDESDSDDISSRVHKGLPLKRKIIRLVSEVYSNAGISLPADEVALIGMEIYAELKSTVADLDDAEEVDLALAHIRHKLKRSALNAIQNPGLGKAEAS